MKRGGNISGIIAGALVASLAMLPVLGVAQKAAPRPTPQHPAAVPQQRMSQAQAPRPQKHAGDWLREYKDLPPDEQEKALQKDKDFQKLAPAKQQRYLQRLRTFSNLPPQQQLRVLNRMETWEHLTPEQKQQALQVYSQMQQLPPDRRRLVHKAIDDLRAMPPDQREQIVNSERFKGMFSDQERDLMRGATRLPLAPPDSGDQPGQQSEQ